MKNPEIQVRRKPRQSRAILTQEALLESFVRLLHDRPADKITIREITDLAGVGLGTFYEYFSKKQDLIALAIHKHIKHNAEHLQDYAHQLQPQMSLYEYLTLVIQHQLEQIQDQQFLWAQTFLLERQISNIESYRKSYSMMLNMWENILSTWMDDAEPEHLKHLSVHLQRLCYGFVSQSLLITPDFDQWDRLQQDILHSMTHLLPLKHASSQ